MNHPYGFALICLCLLLGSLIGVAAGAAAADPAQYDKSVSISMNIDNGKITTKSAEIYYGSAPHLIPNQQGFRGELVAADGSIVRTFTVWDPRIQFGDVLAATPDGTRIQGVVDSQPSADFVVTFPFDPKVTGFRLLDPATGTLLASVNLVPQIDSFFASYPDDPDNPATYGLRAPATVTAPQANAPGPVAKSTGQFFGLLAIGSGAVLILAGIFISRRFLQVRPKSVLIVDDNPDIIEVIGIMLRMAGYSTRSAGSGEECLTELKSGIPDLILLDIGMEPMDGWETLKRIKKNPATQGIPVMMLTAKRLTPKDVEDYGICIEDYVVKPVTPQDLTDAITHVFARRQMIRERIAAAKGAGINRSELCECARLTRVVDVNKRLWDLLVKTYDLEEGAAGPENEITLAIRNTERKIRDQEHRLEQIQRNLGSGAKG